jgi:hypothetical protein
MGDRRELGHAIALLDNNTKQVSQKDELSQGEPKALCHCGLQGRVQRSSSAQQAAQGRKVVLVHKRMLPGQNCNRKVESHLGETQDNRRHQVRIRDLQRVS